MVAHNIEVGDGDDEIVIRIQAANVPTDLLVPIERDALRVLGLEERAVRRLVEDGKLRAVTIGRRRYTKMSFLLALVDELPQASAVAPDDDVAIAISAKNKRNAKKWGAT